MKALIWRDILLAVRSGGGFGLAVAFFLILTVLVPFGVGPDSTALARIAPGVLWLGALLACLLSLDRLFALDYEDGTLEALLMSPLPVEGLVAAKALAHWITTCLPLVITAPLFGFLLKLDSSGYVWLCVSLALGTPALSFLLVLPLYIPTLIFGAMTMARGIAGQTASTPLLLLAAMTCLSLALLPFAAGAALKAALR